MSDARFQPSSAQILSGVRTGMKVFDASGDQVGSVDDLSMGDPEAATTEGNEVRPTGGVVRDLAEAVSGDEGEPNVPEPLRSRLVREGYIKISKGLFRSDVYVSSQQVQRVDGDRVTLSVRRDQLEE